MIYSLIVCLFCKKKLFVKVLKKMLSHDFLKFHAPHVTTVRRGARGLRLRDSASVYLHLRPSSWRPAPLQGPTQNVFKIRQDAPHSQGRTRIRQS